MKMGKIEILAPCGGFECVEAAVRSGADAVYLGAKDFSARAGAENFSEEQLKQAVDYCHIRGVKVYLTLNTVAFDSELEKIREIIISAAEASVDALIVQNMGVAVLAKRLVPRLPLHASTQMSVHSPRGARLLWEQGFKRVVLAREMTRKEISEVAQGCPAELEVFVHGALCMSVSGQCYFSALLGGRSGNRGRCAQTCRLPFSVQGEEGHALSLKDNSIIKYIEDLQSIGVASAKIEGRLKRPEYVAAAVSACVKARDTGVYERTDEERLEKVFSRTGFTQGYYTGNRGYEMFGYRKKEDVTAATPGLLAQIRSEYKDEPKKVVLHGGFTAEAYRKPGLTLSDGENAITLQGEKHCEKAVSKPLTEDKCRNQLMKTGGTPYNIEELTVDIKDSPALSCSQLNSLRRRALEELSRLRKAPKNYKINDYQIPRHSPHKASAKKTYGRFISAEIGGGFKALDMCFVPIFSRTEKIKSLVDRGFSVGVEIPRGIFGEEEQVESRLRELKAMGIEDALCNNYGAVYLAKTLSFKIHGGFGLNFTNTLDLQWAEEYGFEDTELSFELTFNQISALGGALPRGIISYGRLPLMLTRNCPCKSVDRDCRDCGKAGKITDRMNKSFPVFCDGCTCEVLNSVPLDETTYAHGCEGLDFHTLRFSGEKIAQNAESYGSFAEEINNAAQKTHGLYLRGVK